MCEKADISDVYEDIELTSRVSRERAHNFYTKNGFEKSSFKFKMKL